MNSHEETVVLTLERLKLTSKEQLEKGPIAIIECIQSIPCDPCIYACRHGVIEKKALTAPAEINYEKCIGCGECVSECPSLAIFVINMNFRERMTLQLRCHTNFCHCLGKVKFIKL